MSDRRSEDATVDSLEQPMRLVHLSDEFETILTGTGTTPDQIKEAIEELRALRRRIHDIDRYLAKGSNPDRR